MKIWYAISMGVGFFIVVLTSSKLEGIALMLLSGFALTIIKD